MNKSLPVSSQKTYAITLFSPEQHIRISGLCASMLLALPTRQMLRDAWPDDSPGFFAWLGLPGVLARLLVTALIAATVGGTGVLLFWGATRWRAALLFALAYIGVY